MGPRLPRGQRPRASTRGPALPRWRPTAAIPPTLPSALVEARALQIAVWTAFMAERHPHLRERARQRLAHWPA
jgi:hypothetical protein